MAVGAGHSPPPPPPPPPHTPHTHNLTPTHRPLPTLLDLVLQNSTSPGAVLPFSPAPTTAGRLGVPWMEIPTASLIKVPVHTRPKPIFHGGPLTWYRGIGWKLWCCGTERTVVVRALSDIYHWKCSLYITVNTVFVIHINIYIYADEYHHIYIRRRDQKDINLTSFPEQTSPPIHRRYI